VEGRFFVSVSGFCFLAILADAGELSSLRLFDSKLLMNEELLVSSDLRWLEFVDEDLIKIRKRVFSLVAD